MKLRYYQQDAIDALWNFLSEKEGNPLICMPTATGKSLVLAGFIKLLLSQYSTIRFMVLSHVKELVSQDYETLKRIWPTAPAGIYSSGLSRKDIRFPIVFGGVASVVNCIKDFGHRDVLLIDEAHLLSPKDGTMYRTIISELLAINPNLRVGGLTATPYRLGQGLLTDGGIFTDICYNKTDMQGFNELLDAGFLCRLVPRPTETELDISDVGIDSTGDYKKNELQAAVDKKDITYKVITELLKYAEGRKSCIIFASGIEHAEHVCDMMNNDFGIPTTVIHSKMKTEERDQRLADFKNYKYWCIVNNSILTTGVDIPQLDICGMLRPTTSPGLWVQMLGRLTRLHPDKKDAVILDFAGNTMRLGPINDPVIPRKKGQRTGTAPIKICPQCNVLVHASVRVCDNCGYEFPKYTKLTRTAGDADIIRSSNKLPESIWVHVSNAFYNVHKPKKGGPECIKVTYWSGLRRFDEYVFPGRGGSQFAKWWVSRSEAPAPRSAQDFMQLVEYIGKPYEIEVKVGGKYDIVNDYRF